MQSNAEQDRPRSSIVSGQVKPRTPLWWFLVVVVCIIYADIALSIFDGSKLNSTQIGGAAFWSGAALACHRGRSGYSRWAGFIAGFAICVPVLFALTFVMALLRKLIGG